VNTLGGVRDSVGKKVAVIPIDFQQGDTKESREELSVYCLL
jgi:hypothetical protein